MIAEFALAAVLLVAPAKTPRVYEGPLSLKWDMTSDQVTAAIGTQLDAHEGNEPIPAGGSGALAYTGTFANDNAAALFFFKRGKYTGAAIIFPGPDVRPASSKWETYVRLMTEKYGKPTKLTAPPEDPDLKKAMSGYPRTKNRDRILEIASLYDSIRQSSRFDLLDAKIMRGEWAPVAEWKFDNSTTVRISVQVNTPDASGMRALTPTWIFAHGDFADDLEKPDVLSEF